VHQSHAAPISSPLELEKVAEIKYRLRGCICQGHLHDLFFSLSFRALLPELLTFAYIPANHLRINASSQQPESYVDPFSDYAASTHTTHYDESEHVLVLEMNDSMVRKKRQSSDSQVSLHTGPAH
jgi:hypothetical protein